MVESHVPGNDNWGFWGRNQDMKKECWHAEMRLEKTHEISVKTWTSLKVQGKNKRNSKSSSLVNFTSKRKGVFLKASIFGGPPAPIPNPVERKINYLRMRLLPNELFPASHMRVTLWKSNKAWDTRSESLRSYLHTPNYLINIVYLLLKFNGLWVSHCHVFCFY